MAGRGCSRRLLLGAGSDFGVGNHRTRFDAADHSIVAERKHGGDRLHHQFAALALCEHAFVAGGFATAALATPGTRRAGFVLWVVPDDVAVESVNKIISVICGFAFLGDGVYSSPQLDGW